MTDPAESIFLTVLDNAIKQAQDLQTPHPLKNFAHPNNTPVFAGGGTSARVYRMMNKVDQKLYAIKVSQCWNDHWIREYKLSSQDGILSTLKNPGLIALIAKSYDAVVVDSFGVPAELGDEDEDEDEPADADKYCIFVLENIPPSKVLTSDLVRPNVGSWATPHALRVDQVELIVAQLLMALDELYREHQIIHRDLKLDNILLLTEKELRNYYNMEDPQKDIVLLKLIDFGHNKTIPDGYTATGGTGTDAHNPPDMVDGCTYNWTVDIFAVGTIALQLLCGYLPGTYCHPDVLARPEGTPEIREKMKLADYESEYDNFWKAQMAAADQPHPPLPHRLNQTGLDFKSAIEIMLQFDKDDHRNTPRAEVYKSKWYNKCKQEITPHLQNFAKHLAPPTATSDSNSAVKK